MEKQLTWEWKATIITIGFMALLGLLLPMAHLDLYHSDEETKIEVEKYYPNCIIGMDFSLICDNEKGEWNQELSFKQKQEIILDEICYNRFNVSCDEFRERCKSYEKYYPGCWRLNETQGGSE